MNFKSFIVKLQNLPEQRKKTIVWVIAIILGLILLFFWINLTINRLNKLGEEQNKTIQTQENKR